MEYTKLLGKVTLTTDGLHDSARTYDRLCLVYDSAYRSFISIKDVPANISIDNKTYWQPLNIITADNEDLMVDENLRIKFANKEYNPTQNSGMGYVILRKRKDNISHRKTSIRLIHYMQQSMISIQVMILLLCQKGVQYTSKVVL